MRRIVLVVLFAVGVGLFIPAWLGATWMGQRWTNSPDATLPWWLNPYLSVTSKTAYNFFAVGLLILGGVLAGWAAAAMLNNRRKSALLLMLGAIVAAGVGFNTFDWMVSYLVGSPYHRVNFTLWNFGLPNVQIDGWNFYIFAMLIPLWLGSFLVSFPIFFTLIQRQKLPEKSAFHKDLESAPSVSSNINFSQPRSIRSVLHNVHCSRGERVHQTAATNKSQ